MSEAIPDFIYKELTYRDFSIQNTVQSWGCYNSDYYKNKVGQQYQAPCMQAASWIKGADYYWVHNTTKAEGLTYFNNKYNKAWSCFLYDPEESPWRSCLDFEYWPYAGKDVNALDHRHMYGCLFSRTKHPKVDSYTVMNFSKAIRVPVEQQPGLARWYRFVGLGFHPALIWVLLPGLRFHNDNEVAICVGTNFYHSFMDYSLLGPKDTVLFARGTPLKGSYYLWDYPSSFGMDGIWGLDRLIVSPVSFQRYIRSKLEDKRRGRQKVSGFFKNVPDSTLSPTSIYPLSDLYDVLQEFQEEHKIPKSTLIERIKKFEQEQF